jgi:aerobic C4-dicarboxylate transport protein
MVALLVGIEKFMSECRALTHVVGNGAAALVVSRWQNELDPADLRAALSQPRPIETNSEQ